MPLWRSGYACAIVRLTREKLQQACVDQFEEGWYPCCRDAFTPYLQDRCLQAACTLYPFAHGGHRAGRSLANHWEQSRGGLVGLEGRGVGSRWSLLVEVARKVEPQLKRGHFSLVIALCGRGPGGSKTAAEAGDVMLRRPKSFRPKCQTQPMTIWHTVRNPRGERGGGISLYQPHFFWSLEVSEA